MDEVAEKTANTSNAMEFGTIEPDSIKEKRYITKQIDTSISILDSSEDDVVLESLLLLSKYADKKITIFTYPQLKRITFRILNLLDRNLYILRLVLRLLGMFLENTPIIFELDQDIYDDKILEITNLYIDNKDIYVKEFSLDILWRLVKSCRLTCLIFKTDVFQPILQTFENFPSKKLLISAFNFLNYLLDSPAALGILVVSPIFDVKTIIAFLYDEDVYVVQKAYEIIIKMTSKDVVAFQVTFRKNHLVEKMMEVVMNPNQKAFHENAFEVIQNCLNCEETRTYHVKTTQFLSFCQWVKDCNEVYLCSCADFFERVTGIPSIIQMLYDLSVEETIISFFRSTEKVVLNKACRALSNLAVHKYCCDDMVRSTVIINKLYDLLHRKDDVVDPYNEVALETFYCLFVRSIRQFHQLQGAKIIPIFLNYFLNPNNLSKKSFSMVVDMLYKLSRLCEYSKSIASEAFFKKVLNLAVSDRDDLAEISLDNLVHFIGAKSFNKLFISSNGPRLLLDKLRVTSDMKVIQFILLFIHSSMFFDEISIEFVRNDVIGVLEKLAPNFLSVAPVVDTIIKLTYNLYLPMKFYKTGKVDLTTKLEHKFYVLCDRINGPFPFLEILEDHKMCPICIIYVVDYTYKTKNNTSITALTTIRSMKSIKQKREQKSMASLNLSNRSNFSGETSSDPYLPYYISYVEKRFEQEWSMEDKIAFLAKYVADLLSGPTENDTISGRIMSFKQHLKSLKYKLSTSVIPIGFLRSGFHCERALLFKAIADRVNVPCSLERRNRIYWNEVALLHTADNGSSVLKFYVVDLMNDVGTLLPIESNDSNSYLKNSMFIIK